MDLSQKRVPKYPKPLDPESRERHLKSLKKMVVTYSENGIETPVKIQEEEKIFFDPNHKKIGDVLREERDENNEKIYKFPTIITRHPESKADPDPETPYRRRFEFKIYAKTASFNENKLVFNDTAFRYVLFEIKNDKRPENANKYITFTVPFSELISKWSKYFPDQKPNAIINGFTDGWSRRFLAVTLDNPKPLDEEFRSVEFDYSLEKINGGFDLDENIKEWTNFEEPLREASAFIGSIDRPVLSSGAALSRNVPAQMFDYLRQSFKESVKI